MDILESELIGTLCDKDLKTWIDKIIKNQDGLVSIDEHTHGDYEEASKTTISFTFLQQRQRN